MELTELGHAITPEPGTERSVLGMVADLENRFHYPVEADCRECGEPAILRHRGAAWLHQDDYFKGTA